MHPHVSTLTPQARDHAAPGAARSARAFFAQGGRHASGVRRLRSGQPRGHAKGQASPGLFLSGVLVLRTAMCQRFMARPARAGQRA